MNRKVLIVIVAAVSLVALGLFVFSSVDFSTNRRSSIAPESVNLRPGEVKNLTGREEGVALAYSKNASYHKIRVSVDEKRKVLQKSFNSSGFLRTKLGDFHFTVKPRKKSPYGNYSVSAGSWKNISLISVEIYPTDVNPSEPRPEEGYYP